MPEEIAKKDLPKKAVCFVCSANGETHGEEKPAAGARYKGKTYYFCNEKEAVAFKQDPEAYMPPVLPRPAPKSLGSTLDGARRDILRVPGQDGPGGLLGDLVRALRRLYARPAKAPR